MNQNRAWGLVGAGVSTLLLTLSIEIAALDTFAQMATTAFVAKVLGTIGGMGVAVFGALQVRPRT